MMVHAYNPSVWAGEEEDEEFGHKASLRPVWATCLKDQKKTRKEQEPKPEENCAVPSFAGNVLQTTPETKQ